MDAATASKLLHSGETLGTRVQGAIDIRTLALIQAGLAIALFVYMVTFFVIFGRGSSPGSGGSTSFSIALLLSFLAATSLIRGRLDTLFAALRSRKPLAMVIEIVCLIPFGIALVATLFGTLIPWGVALGIAICGSIPAGSLALVNGKRARASAVRPADSAPRVPLSPSVRAVTITLAVMFGIATASAACDWSPVVGLILLAVMMVFITLHSTMWSLAAVGAEWGQAQWLGFAASFLLLMTATIVIALTRVDSPLAGVVAGLVVAAPLVFSAFRGSSIHTRAEEFWDAPAAQS